MMKHVLLKTIKYTPDLTTVTCGPELLPVEIYNLRKLSHPNLQNLLRYTFRSQTWTLALEWSETWTTLEQWLKHHILDDLEVRDLMGQVTSVVSYCLDMGVDHRDISTSSLLYDPAQGCVKLAMFQHSQVYSILPHTLRSSSPSHTITPPELYRVGTCTAEGAAVWSIGCLLFEMITGEKPIRSYSDAAKNNVKWEALSPATTDPQLYDTILQCLNPHPGSRVNLVDLRDQSVLASHESFV